MWQTYKRLLKKLVTLFERIMTDKSVMPWYEKAGPGVQDAGTGQTILSAHYLRRRLSHLTASQVPMDWNTCTMMTSSTVATTMMRYL